MKTIISYTISQSETESKSVEYSIIYKNLIAFNILNKVHQWWERRSGRRYGQEIVFNILLFFFKNNLSKNE
jgi:hypothetical protein